jgi:putative Mg2+ transporter-C (MgtC) family protein
MSFLQFNPAELHFVWSLLLAAVFGSMMGINRSMVGKHAGMRTYALVALGSCAFTIVSTLSSFELATFPGINPLQIAASVVIGIGFIGTGLAAFRGDHPVELTTASGVWAVAAVGMACGYQLYVIALATTLISICIFWFLSPVEHRLRVRWGVDTSSPQ